MRPPATPGLSGHPGLEQQYQGSNAEVLTGAGGVGRLQLAAGVTGAGLATAPYYMVGANAAVGLGAEALTAGGQHIGLNMPRIAQGLGYVHQYAWAEAGGAGVVGGGGALVWQAAAREAQAAGGGGKALAYTAANFRDNLSRLTGGIPEGAQAHHVLPQKFAAAFQKAGLNIHDPKFGAWWDAASHAKNSAAYNERWQQFLGTNPTADRIVKFAKDISGKYGYQTHF
jgi:hypothetical protein